MILKYNLLMESQRSVVDFPAENFVLFFSEKQKIFATLPNKWLKKHWHRGFGLLLYQRFYCVFIVAKMQYS